MDKKLILSLLITCLMLLILNSCQSNSIPRYLLENSIIDNIENIESYPLAEEAPDKNFAALLQAWHRLLPLKLFGQIKQVDFYRYSLHASYDEELLEDRELLDPRQAILYAYIYQDKDAKWILGLNKERLAKLDQDTKASIVLRQLLTMLFIDASQMSFVYHFDNPKNPKMLYNYYLNDIELAEDNLLLFWLQPQAISMATEEHSLLASYANKFWHEAALKNFRSDLSVDREKQEELYEEYSSYFFRTTMPTPLEDFLDSWLALLLNREPRTKVQRAKLAFLEEQLSSSSFAHKDIFNNLIAQLKNE